MMKAMLACFATWCTQMRERRNSTPTTKFNMRIMHVGDDAEHVNSDKAKIRVILIKFIRENVFFFLSPSRNVHGQFYS